MININTKINKNISNKTIQTVILLHITYTFLHKQLKKKLHK